jgi:uncharacterized membrane protein YgcG
LDPTPSSSPAVATTTGRDARCGHDDAPRPPLLRPGTNDVRGALKLDKGRHPQARRAGAVGRPARLVLPGGRVATPHDGPAVVPSHAPRARLLWSLARRPEHVPPPWHQSSPPRQRLRLYIQGHGRAPARLHHPSYVAVQDAAAPRSGSDADHHPALQKVPTGHPPTSDHFRSWMPLLNTTTRPPTSRLSRPLARTPPSIPHLVPHGPAVARSRGDDGSGGGDDGEERKEGRRLRDAGGGGGVGATGGGGYLGGGGAAVGGR